MSAKTNISSGLLERLPDVEKQGWPWTIETPEGVYAIQTEWPRISIITPSFNQASFIEQTIRSVLLQNYPNLCYVVMDGGSTDETVNILERYSPWINYWISESDYGQSDAINKGLLQCDGEWFNWINSDDYLMPSALLNMVKAAKNKGVKIVSGVTENVRDDVPFGSYSTNLHQQKALSLFSLGVNQPGSLLYLEDVKSFGGVRNDLDLCMDLDLWLRILLRREQPCYESICETVAAYRYHAKSKTCIAENAFALEEFSLLSDLYEELSGRYISNSLRELREQCSAKKSNYQSSQKFDPDIVERAYFDRLIIKDALLFRAITRASSWAKQPFFSLKIVLNEIRPRLQHIYGDDAIAIESMVWLRAMQHRGCLSADGVISLLMSDLKFSTVRELTRIAVRGN